jgi:DNA gyrase/topoisomerase IV subunit A
VKTFARTRIIERQIGWSTNIPNYNPADIVANIKRQMQNEPLVQMVPWWRGFKGNVVPGADGRWTASGIVRKIDDTTVEIMELPIRKWTQDFKKQLEQMIEEKSGGGVKVCVRGLSLKSKVNRSRITKSTTTTCISTSSLPCLKARWRELRNKGLKSTSSWLINSELRI